MTEPGFEIADRREPFDLSGRVAIVTGAGGGLGRAIGLALGRAGAHVVCTDLAKEAAVASVRAIEHQRGTAEAVRVDVTSSAAMHALVDDIVDRHHRLDVMCNIAGVSGDGALVEDLDEATFDRQFAVHFKGVLFGCQAAVRVMTGAGRGSIINMSSTAIDTPRARLASYSVAKAAVAELTKILAVEAGPAGVRVNAIAPGFVLTPLSVASITSSDGVVDPGKLAAMEEAMAAMSPLGRTGQPEDIGDTVLFLASDASRFLTGQTLRPNGGASMPW